MKSFKPLVSLKYIFLVLSSLIIHQSGFCQISIIGTATPAGEFFTDFDLVQDVNNPSVWTGQILLQKDAFFKFRADDNWTKNWGADVFPSGPLFHDGANIMVDSTAIYNMTFDSTALTYQFIVVNIPTIALKENGQVGIGTISPNESAKLEIASTTQGLLPPRMIKEQRDQISNPEAGLMLWCTDCGIHGEIQVHNGIKWTNIIGGIASTSPYPSIQMGMDIDGVAAGDENGTSVSLSSDGTRLAIGSPYNDGNGSNSGHVRVFEWNGNMWIQLGLAIDGEAAFDLSGWSVSLSADGTRLAIGSIFNDGNGSNSGHVRVFEWDGNIWIQLGTDIDGEAAEDQSGRSVSLSADGSRLAIGSIGNDGNGTNAGHVRVFEWDGIMWIQLGIDIDGEAAFDQSGWSVSLSADGIRLAIGSQFNGGNGIDAGHVRVFEWDGNMWIQLGIAIDGEAAFDLSGWSVSLSADGTRLAIGSVGNGGNGTNAGHVRVFEWDGIMWIQLGIAIDGEAAFDLSGWSVSLSADGTRLAIGSIGNGNGTDAGHVRVFEWDGNMWIQLGIDIDGEAADDQSGWSVSLSADGTRLAIGSIGNDGNGTNAGHVRVFE